jgi:ATP/maltotriose-dependent transcriptional regulator MalT
MAHTLGNRALIAHATAMSALGAMVTGDIDRAGERRSAGTEMLDSMSDEQVSTEMLARTTDPLTSTSLFLEHLDDASRVAERALAIARSTGRGQVLPVLFWAGVVRTARGELARAVELFDLATEIARSTGHEEGSVWHLIGRSQAAAAGGDYEGALAAAEESMDVLAHSEPSFLRVWAALALAASLRATGGADRAAELLLDTGGGGLARFPAPWIADAYELLAHCRLDQGRLEEARDAAAGAQAAAERVQLSMSHAAADRAAASVALATGDGAAAADLALRAAEAATIVGMPLRAADACMLAGRALAAADRREEAIEQLELASSAFERHGATRRRDAAERELGKLGRRRHRRTRAGKHDGDGVEALTERELEVAWLVVDRKTNAQIAGELFLSEKTVESHLRHLFQKLGVSSRVEVARVVERAGRQGTAAR